MHADTKTHRIAAFLVGLAALVSDAVAGRGPGEPLITQLDAGHGLIVAAVTASALEPVDPANPAAQDHRLTFRVEEVLASPPGDPDWPLKVGGSFVWVTRVGYGAAIEQWEDVIKDAKPLPDDQVRQVQVGTRFRLSIRRAADSPTGFWHADGSDEAKQVLGPFPDDQRRSLRTLREVAALKGAARLDRCRAVAADKAAGVLARAEVLRYLQRIARVGHRPDDAAGGAAWDADLKTTAAALRRAWADVDGDTPADVLYSLDTALSGNVDPVAFHDSKDRRAKWLVWLFAPKPAAGTPREVTAALLKRPVAVLARLAEKEPDEVGDAVAAQLADERWPTEFGTEILTTLASINYRAGGGRPKWDAAFRAYAVRTLPRADGWQTVRLASVLTQWADAERAGKVKPMERTQAFAAAVRAAADRAETAAKTETDEGRPFARALPELRKAAEWAGR